MTSSQLIKKLQELDPEGTMEMLVYDGDGMGYCSMNHPSLINVDDDLEVHYNKEPNCIACSFN